MADEPFYVVLTEDGYTTADGPMTKPEAQADFARFASTVSPHSGSRLRVMSETEYQRAKPTGTNA